MPERKQKSHSIPNFLLHLFAVGSLLAAGTVPAIVVYELQNNRRNQPPNSQKHPNPQTQNQPQN